MGVTLQNLPGPASVPRVRTERYIGDENTVKLQSMIGEHALAVERMYAFLRDTFATLETGVSDGDPMWTMERLKSMRVLEQIKRFASVMRTDDYDGDARRMMRQVFHDMRGGALTVAYSLVQLAEMKGSEVEISDVYSIFFAVRDHLKIMRNCVVDLDPERRGAT